MNRDELLALPVTTDLLVAANAMGIGRTTAYQLARANQFPVKVLRLGARYRVVTSDLLAALGIAPSETSATTDTRDPSLASSRPAPPLRSISGL